MLSFRRKFRFRFSFFIFFCFFSFRIGLILVDRTTFMFLFELSLFLKSSSSLAACNLCCSCKRAILSLRLIWGKSFFNWSFSVSILPLSTCARLIGSGTIFFRFPLGTFSFQDWTYHLLEFQGDIVFRSICHNCFFHRYVF